MSVPVYHGRFGATQAERLLWRAGFGPAPGEARKLGRKGLRRAVLSLTRPKGKARLRGPAPHDDDGLPLAPATHGATTCSGGSTGWSAPISRWSSG